MIDKYIYIYIYIFACIVRLSRKKNDKIKNLLNIYGQ
jgi:hypothetical protein